MKPHRLPHICNTLKNRVLFTVCYLAHACIYRSSEWILNHKTCSPYHPQHGWCFFFALSALNECGDIVAKFVEIACNNRKNKLIL